MHTVELLEQAIGVAEQLGYQVRQEWLGGSGGGGCEFAGRKWIFIDLSLSTVEQLDQVTETLRADPGLTTVELPSPTRRLLRQRRAA
jgi:hypothetical protein